MEIKKKIEKLDTLNITSRTKGKWFDIIIANVIALVFVSLGMFMPLLSFALAFIVMAYMQVGLYGFVLRSYRGESPEFESIFLPFNRILKVLCIKIIVMAGIVIWGLLLIVPGIIYGLNNAFAALVFLENPELSTKQIFARSKKLTFGKRGEIFTMILGTIALVCLAMTLGMGVHLLLGLAFKVPTWLTIILILAPAAIMLLTLALPLFETFLVASYEDAKQHPVLPKKKDKEPKVKEKKKSAPKKVSKT